MNCDTRSNKDRSSMHRPFILWCLLMIITTLVDAFQLTIKSPHQSTVWRHKKTVWVFWSSSDGPPESFDSIDIDLMVGQGDGMLIQNISFGVPWSEKGAEWLVADSLQPGCDYFVQITSPKDKSFKVKSARFAITGKKGWKRQSSGSAWSIDSSWWAMAIALSVAQLVFWRPF